VGLIEWARSPWGQDVPIHIAFFLIWVAAIAGLVFFIGHAIWLRYFAGRDEYAGEISPEEAARIPEKIARHSLGARLFHWVMAASMLALLITAFLPRVGVRFPWVTYHWIAGVVLTASVLFHIFHATFVMDPWSIWPDKTDIQDSMHRLRRAFGKDAPPPHRFAKYPMENKMYHMAIVAAGLSAILTGVFMMFRVRTNILPRNPYLFGDMTWGLMYVLHGAAGIGLISLIMIHVYFALRPEKLVITKSMIFGTLDKEHYLEEHDPARWAPQAK
jgi:cytochrome b subunit of formate dehydrogenase